MKHLFFAVLTITSINAYATGNHEQTSGNTSQNASLNSFQQTTVKSSTNSSSFSGSVAKGGAAYSSSQGGNATGGDASNSGNRLSVNQNQTNQVASQGAVFAQPQQNQLSCDGTVGGAVNTPFSGLTAIWGHTDSTCPTMQMKNFLLSQGLEHEACLLMAQYAKDQELNFNQTMCANVHNTNIIRN